MLGSNLSTAIGVASLPPRAPRYPRPEQRKPTVPISENRLVKAAQLAFSNPWTPSDRDALADARSAILNALDRQQERALRDEAIVILTPEEIRAVPEFADPDGAVAAAKAARKTGGESGGEANGTP